VCKEEKISDRGERERERRNVDKFWSKKEKKEKKRKCEGSN
jgi:hypothetical protein